VHHAPNALDLAGAAVRRLGSVLLAGLVASAAVGQDDPALRGDEATGRAAASSASAARKSVAAPQIVVDRDVAVPMRDGVALRVDVYRPDDGERHPVILTRTPYDKTRVRARGRLNPLNLAADGYVTVGQDVRGRYASDGAYAIGEHVTPTGMNDAYDTIEWIAAQPWSDGNVGMVGGSYEGSIQWPAAVMQPPHLKAIVPVVGPSGILFDQALFGGPPYFAFLTYWTVIMAADVVDRHEASGKDVARERELMRRAMSDRDAVLRHLPLESNPYLDFEGLREMYSALILGFNPDFESPVMRAVLADYARRFGFAKPEDAIFWPFHKVAVPVLNVGGWYDISSWSAFKNFNAMREQGATEVARAGQHVLMGPWQHSAGGPEYLGDLDFGPSSVGSVVIERHVMAFFDRYLRGADQSLAPVRYFTMGENRWHDADAWPPEEARVESFYLRGSGSANTAAGDGALSSQPAPGDEPPDRFVYDPADPVPTTGGRHIDIGGVIPGPREQARVERRQDVLCYTTPVLEKEIEITGDVALRLFAATSAKDTDFTVTLVDVHPDGSAYNVTDGVVRARYRKGPFRPTLVEPGAIEEYRIQLGPTSHLFKSGHRLRVDVSSSNFPAWDRNLNTGNPIGKDAAGVKATQTIHHSAAHASRLEVSVMPR
jgi:putative CocE/NonD family hydrolase